MKKWIKWLKAVLFHKMNAVYYLQRSDALPHPLSRQEESLLLKQMKDGDEEAKNRLIEHNLRLVVYIAKRFDNTGVGVEDLISIGTIGLIKGISTFKTDKNVRLATYLSRCIENEVLMHFRATRKLQGEVSLSDSLDTDQEGNALSLMDVISVDDTMLEDLDARESCMKVRRCVDTCLTGREADVIRLRFGLDGGEPLTQREVAVKYGISRSYVSRIEKKAVEKLRAALDNPQLIQNGVKGNIS